MAENEEKEILQGGGASEGEKKPAAVDLYFQPVEEGDEDELKNLAENPRASRLLLRIRTSSIHQMTVLTAKMIFRSLKDLKPFVRDRACISVIRP